MAKASKQALSDRWPALPAAAWCCASRRLPSGWSPFGATDEGRTDLRGLTIPAAAGIWPHVLHGGIENADLSGAVTPHLRLREFTVKSSFCRGADFEDAHFDGRVEDTTFERTRFRLSALGGSWVRTAFVKCTFARSWFDTGAILERCTFDSCTYGSLEFNIELRDVEFRGLAEGLDIAPYPRLSSSDRARPIQASLRHATLRKCWFTRGVDLDRIELPEMQEWVILPDAARKLQTLAADLAREDPENAAVYKLFASLQFAAQSQPEMLYVRNDLVAEYGEPAATRLWERLCREGGRSNQRL